MNILALIKCVTVRLIVLVLSMGFGAATILAEVIATQDLHDRVGNGWHMYTKAAVNSDGTISGTTTLKNYNNIKGFTGGLFVVAVDENMEPLYSTAVHQWGVNSAFFSKCRTRTVSWTEKIPAEYLGDVASIAIIQQHTPTRRVWVWIYENRELIVNKALLFLEIFQKAKTHQLTDDDIWQAVNEVADLLESTDSDFWLIEHLEEISDISRMIYELAKKEPNSWVPENADEAKELVNTIMAMTEKDFDWNDIDAVEQLIKDIAALIGHPEGWVPENMKDVQDIVESFYVLIKDEPVPDNVKDTISEILEHLDKINNLT